MSLLAALCILLGLGAPLGVALVYPATGQLLGNSIADAVINAIRPPLLFVSLGSGLIVTVAIIWAALRRWLLSGRTLAEEPTWDCGYVRPTARMQYTASSFAWPVIEMFRWLAHPRLHVYMGKGNFPQQAHLVSHTDDFFCRHFFEPGFKAVETLARCFHRLQQGRNQLYILYIAIVVLALLVLKVR